MTLDALDFTIADVPDAAPPSDYEYACQTCGKELFYAGKGRKPKACDEHKSRRGTGTPKGGNVALARQAAGVLTQLNGLLAMALFAPVPAVGLPLPLTASALASAAEGFDEAAYAALSTDPALCKLILRGGGASGKVALVIAYGMLAGAVVPVGIAEYKDRGRKQLVDSGAEVA